MKHFADVVVAEDPDVITLQEVRVDTTFSSPYSTITHWSYSNDGGTVNRSIEIAYVFTFLLLRSEGIEARRRISS